VRSVSLFRLYTLRLSYLILALGIGLYFWPSVIHHTPERAVARGAQLSLLAGIGAISLLGFRYPVKMIPILLFEILWKAIYLTFFALPLWRAHQITPAIAADITSIAMVVIFLPLIPWVYVWREYATAPGSRWR
jgi:hypothetical protein